MRSISGFTSIMVAVVLGAVLISGAQADNDSQRPTLTIALEPEKRTVDGRLKLNEGGRAHVYLDANGTITSSAAQNCQAVVSLEDVTAEDGDYRRSPCCDVIMFKTGENTRSGGPVWIDALQDDDSDDETVRIRVSVQCGGIIPTPLEEQPTAPQPTVFVIEDNDRLE